MPDSDKTRLSIHFQKVCGRKLIENLLKCYFLIIREKLRELHDFLRKPIPKVFCGCPVNSPKTYLWGPKPGYALMTLYSGLRPNLSTDGCEALSGYIYSSCLSSFKYIILNLIKCTFLTNTSPTSCFYI